MRTRPFEVGRAACVLVLVAAVLGAFGPGDWAHHQIHKLGLPGSFGTCCCVYDALHLSCAWHDHFGARWSEHHPRVAALASLLIVPSALGFAAFQLACSALRRLPPRRMPR